MTDPDHARVHDMVHRLVTIQALVSDPQLPQRTNGLKAAIDETFGADPVLSVFMMGSYGAMRFVSMEELVKGRAGPDAALKFPRDVLLESRPPSASEDVQVRCIDLIEAIATKAPTGDQPLELVRDYGSEALWAATSLTARLGKLLVDVDPSVNSLEELVAQEGVDSEAGWFACGGSY